MYVFIKKCETVVNNYEAVIECVYILMFESYTFHFVIYASLSVINAAVPRTIYSRSMDSVPSESLLFKWKEVLLIFQYLEDKCIDQ